MTDIYEEYTNVQLLPTQKTFSHSAINVDHDRRRDSCHINTALKEPSKVWISNGHPSRIEMSNWIDSSIIWCCYVPVVPAIALRAATGRDKHIALQAISTMCVSMDVWKLVFLWLFSKGYLRVDQSDWPQVDFIRVSANPRLSNSLDRGLDSIGFSIELCFVSLARQLQLQLQVVNVFSIFNVSVMFARRIPRWIFERKCNGF